MCGILWHRQRRQAFSGICQWALPRSDSRIVNKTLIYPWELYQPLRIQQLELDFSKTPLQRKPPRAALP